MNARKEALKILENSYIGTMATIRDQKPHSRYMTFFHEDFTIYTATSKETSKIEDIEENPYTHILLGYEGKNFGDEFLEIEGKISLSTDESMKEKVWDDAMKIWFEGPDDPDLIILKITPTSIRLMNVKGKEPINIDL